MFILLTNHSVLILAQTRDMCFYEWWYLSNDPLRAYISENWGYVFLRMVAPV